MASNFCMTLDKAQILSLSFSICNMGVRAPTSGHGQEH